MAGPLVRRAARAVGIDPAVFNDVAQAGHFACGWAVVMTAAALTGSAWLALVGVLLFALVKEFWWDERYETADVRGSSLEDYAFYALGAWGALLAYGVFG